MNANRKRKQTDDDELNLAAVARAYKILFFRTKKGGKVLRLLFSEESDEDRNDGHEPEVNPETEVKFQEWCANGRYEKEKTFAMQMLFEEQMENRKNEKIIERLLNPATALPVEE